MGNKMKLTQATAELKRLKSLDGNEYCMTMSSNGDWRVGLKTSEQKVIDSYGPQIANTTVLDFIHNYDKTDDLH